MKIQILFLFFFPLLLSACVGVTPAARTERANDMAGKAGFSRQDITAPPFVLGVWSKITDPTQPVHLYIEGDGAAWISRRDPASNPTPSKPLGLDLAVNDPGPNVVYIARPCQFVPLKTPGNDCSADDWTSARFGPRVITAYHSALDQIKVFPPFQGKDTPKFHVIGYSGGGYIAIILAGTRPDILTLRTVAGNLDNHAFTALHRVSVMPITVALLPPVRDRLSRIPQRHFVGSNDTTIPPAIAQSYQSSLPHKNCVTIDVVPSTDHQEGWVDHWASFMARPVICR